MPAEPLAVTLQVIEAFEQLSIPYWIGGSLAAALHGVTRSTLDTDLIAAIPLERVDEFAAALDGSFYVDGEMIRDAVLHQVGTLIPHSEWGENCLSEQLLFQGSYNSSLG